MFIFVLFSTQWQKSTKFDYKWNKHTWCASYSNQGLQNGRGRRNHWAMASTISNRTKCLSDKRHGSIIVWFNKSSTIRLLIKLTMIARFTFLNEPTQASFCLFSFFSNTIFYKKKTVWFSGIQTRIVGVEGEHDDHFIAGFTLPSNRYIAPR